MPHGHNIATCLHCGKVEMVGDCITSICNECHKAGHRGMPLIGDDPCPACRWEIERRKTEHDRIWLAEKVTATLRQAETALLAARKTPSLRYDVRQTINAAIDACQELLRTVDMSTKGG